MQGGEVKDKFKAIFEDLNLPLNEINAKYTVEFKQQDDKKIKKKLKKYFIEADDSNQTVIQKFNKMFDQLIKNYELTSKSFAKVKQAQNVIERNETQNEKANQQKVVVENLYNSFRSKYDQELKKAQQIQKEEQNKRKEVIDELQGRIKTIQQKYEQAGKNKIQKYKEHQTLKHELNKLQPHLIASQSLYDAQLKKKTIQIEIQMTTLKQKIQMMKNFKKMAGDTQEKVNTAKTNQEKIGKRIKTLEGKEQEHKILLTKAHLVFEDYKKAIHKLKDILPKKQKQAFMLNDRINKGKSALTDIAKTLVNLDKQYDTQVAQLQTLKNLEQNLTNQLQA